ncbi:MAG TPA: ribonuclease P protein component 1 [Candidatus Bathyarchaeia archaeon]|nr:ribonuclease P protein component 1 [Candidatus Bathyarchaeia archaeon]
MKAAATVVQGELIGLDAKVARSTNPSNMGISGKVIDETRNTLVIRHDDNDKIVAKETAVFHFTLPNGTVIEVEGNAILGRPQDRVKKKPKRRW